MRSESCCIMGKIVMPLEAACRHFRSQAAWPCQKYGHPHAVIFQVKSITVIYDYRSFITEFCRLIRYQLQKKKSHCPYWILGKHNLTYLVWCLQSVTVATAVPFCSCPWWALGASTVPLQICVLLGQNSQLVRVLFGCRAVI